MLSTIGYPPIQAALRDPSICHVIAKRGQAGDVAFHPDSMSLHELTDRLVWLVLAIGQRGQLAYVRHADAQSAPLPPEGSGANECPNRRDKCGRPDRQAAEYLPVRTSTNTASPQAVGQ